MSESAGVQGLELKPIGFGEDSELFEVRGAEATLVEIAPAGFRDARDRLVHSAAEQLKAGKALEPEVITSIQEDNKAKKKLLALAADYELDEKEIKRFVKAKAVKMAIEGDEEATQLGALKLLAGMPGVGLASSYAKVQIAIGSLSPETQSLLAQIDVKD